MNEEPRAWANEVGGILDDLGQAWVLAGALAAGAYRSELRVTGDADLLTRWDADLPARLEAAGFDVAITADREGEHPHLLRIRRGESVVDVIVADSEYQHEALDRGRDRHLLTVEDVLIHKVLADRSRDRGDVASILSTDPELDLQYLHEWMEAWDITDRWEAALDRDRRARLEPPDAGLDQGS